MVTKMSDLIDRNDAIMAVKAGALSAATIFGRTDEGMTALYETVRAIKALPSAQPDEQCDNCHYKHIWMTQRMNGNGFFGHGGATG